MAFQEHTYLAARATGAALGARDPEFKAAAARARRERRRRSRRRSARSTGRARRTRSCPSGGVTSASSVDYTVGVATKDKAQAGQGRQDARGYSQDFRAFLASANPNLPKDVVAGLVKDHILTLKPVIDAQAAGDQPKVYTLLRARDLRTCG